MLNEKDIYYWEKILKGLINTLVRTLDDFMVYTEKSRLYYNIDFAYLAPLLFPSRMVFDDKAEAISTLFTKYEFNENNLFLISGATFLEILDQFNHIESLYSGTLKSALKNIENEDDFNKALLSSQEMINFLKASLQKGFNETLNAPILKLNNLLQNKKISGLGDYYKNIKRTEREKIQKIYEKFLDIHFRERIPTEQVRKIEDRFFHYKVDAINSCLTFYFNQRDKALKEKHLFLTPQRTNTMLCYYGGDHYARNHLAPLYFLNIIELIEKKYISDGKKFLIDAIENCNKVIVDLQAYDKKSINIDSLPIFELRRLDNLYQTYLLPIHNTIELERFDIDVKNKLFQFLENKNQFDANIDNSLLEFKKTSEKFISTYSFLLDENIISDFKLSDDPVYKKLKERYF